MRHVLEFVSRPVLNAARRFKAWVEEVSGHAAWRAQVDLDIAEHEDRLYDLEDEVREVSGVSLLLYQKARAHGIVQPGARSDDSAGRTPAPAVRAKAPHNTGGTEGVGKHPYGRHS